MVRVNLMYCLRNVLSMTETHPFYLRNFQPEYTLLH